MTTNEFFRNMATMLAIAVRGKILEESGYDIRKTLAMYRNEPNLAQESSSSSSSSSSNQDVIKTQSVLTAFPEQWSFPPSADKAPPLDVYQYWMKNRPKEQVHFDDVVLMGSGFKFPQDLSDMLLFVITSTIKTPPISWVCYYDFCAGGNIPAHKHHPDENQGLNPMQFTLAIDTDRPGLFTLGTRGRAWIPSLVARYRKEMSSRKISTPIPDDDVKEATKFAAEVFQKRDLPASFSNMEWPQIWDAGDIKTSLSTNQPVLAAPLEYSSTTYKMMVCLLQHAFSIPPVANNRNDQCQLPAYVHVSIPSIRLVVDPFSFYDFTMFQYSLAQKYDHKYEIGSEFVFHGTSRANALSIVKQGFVKQEKSRCAHGEGAYFALRPVHALRYAVEADGFVADDATSLPCAIRP